MEYKSQGLQKHIIEKRNEVNGLIQHKSMITESNHQSHLQHGKQVNSVSCWNQNLYSSLLSEVSHLIDERISDHQNQLKQLEYELQQQTIKTKGVDRLLQKEIQFNKGKEKRGLDIETDQHLQSAFIE